MFLNLEGNFYDFFFNKKKKIRVGPVFQARVATITNFIFVCGLIHKKYFGQGNLITKF